MAWDRSRPQASQGACPRPQRRGLVRKPRGNRSTDVLRNKKRVILNLFQDNRRSARETESVIPDQARDDE